MITRSNNEPPARSARPTEPLYRGAVKCCIGLFRVTAFGASLTLTFLVAAPTTAQQPEATIIALDSLKWTPIGFPGITIAVGAGNPMASGTYVIFVKFAPGAKALPHTHPDQRVVTVLSGIIHVGLGAEMDEGKSVVLKPGSVVIIPADAPHYGWTTDSEAVLQEVGTAPTGTKVWPKAIAK
jgi:quercetin dioxygenase-like cupin family protein